MANRFKALVGRALLAVGLCAAAMPLAAQDAAGNAANEATAVTPAPADTIGPRELSDFNLNGTVTRRAEQPGQPVAQPPSQAPAATSPATNQARQGSPPSPASTRRSPPAETREAAAGERPAVDLLSRLPTPPEATRRPATAAATSVAPAFSGIDTNAPVATDSGFSPLPWIAALLLLGAGAAIYFGRQSRGRHAPAAGLALPRDTAPQPSPPVPAPRSVPAPQPTRKPPTTLIPKPPAGAAAGPSGIVSTSLRPWLEIELKPLQAALNDDHAAIAFEVTLFNSGSAPARDVAVEACLFNAGAQQDQRLGEFFGMPGKVKDTIPLIAPLSRVALKSAVRLKREAVMEYEVEGRKLFMPLVAINSRYRWSSGEGQSGGGFLVGRGGEGQDKLAPLRVDQGVRAWKSLGVRRYEKGLRR